MSQPATTATPRRQGRPRKDVTPIAASARQFPGVVIPLTYAGRLRVGAICEVHGCVKCHMDNGHRVVVLAIEPGRVLVRALGAPLTTIVRETGELNPIPAREAFFDPRNLYRVGYQPESCHG